VRKGAAKPKTTPAPANDDRKSAICADIDRWDDIVPDGDPAILVIKAHALLGRARKRVKERSGEPPWLPAWLRAGLTTTAGPIRHWPAAFLASNLPCGVAALQSAEVIHR
jgi:hypothetical protein